jgi:hypothetical protein
MANLPSALRALLETESSAALPRLTHNTAQTRFVEVNSVRYAYRQFGAATGTPLVFLQHFCGGLDHWDPEVTNGLGKDRPVILFNVRRNAAAFAAPRPYPGKGRRVVASDESSEEGSKGSVGTEAVIDTAAAGNRSTNRVRLAVP